MASIPASALILNLDEALSHFSQWTPGDRVTATAWIEKAGMKKFYVRPSGSYVTGHGGPNRSAYRDTQVNGLLMHVGHLAVENRSLTSPQAPKWARVGLQLRTRRERSRLRPLNPKGVRPLVLAFSIRLAGVIHAYLHAYVPTNIVIRYLRSAGGRTWVLPISLACTIAYLAATTGLTTVLNADAPGGSTYSARP